MKYYRKLKVNSIYRVTKTTFSDGTPTETLDRWNWDMGTWNGHIHDYTETRKQIKESILIIPISEIEVFKLINS